MSINDLKQAIYELIRDDAMVKGYTGYTSIDPRVYKAWPKDEVDITSTKAAYIVYLFGAQGPQVGCNGEQEGDRQIFIDVYARVEDTAELILEQIKALIKANQPFEDSGNYRACIVTSNGSTTVQDSARRLWHKAATFTIELLFLG